MKKLVLQIRRNGQLLGSWSLNDDPLELGFVDIVTGEELATLTATGHRRGLLVDESTLIRRDALSRVHGDDLTMPLPERTEGSLTGALEEIPPPDGDRLHEETTSAALDAVSISGHRVPGDDLTMPLPEQLEPVGEAEVWRRWKQAWTSVGRLAPGQKVTAFGGLVVLTSSGELKVRAGPTLSGSASLPDGGTREIPPGDTLHALPSGSSVMLRWEESGLYVRSVPPAQEPPLASV